MTDRAQFEAMLEALINENHDAAKEIFHNIVVGKSREIYEELLESDFSQDQGNPYGKEEVDEEEGDEAPEEMPMEADDEEADDAEDDSDAEDDEMDMDSDDEMDMDSDDSAEGGDMEDRVMDLEDALEDLKAEFEQLLAGEEAEENDHPGIHDMGGDDMPAMSMDSEEDDLDQMMEYVNKVSPPKHGDNGANAKSIVAGKNDMGGTSANIAKSFSTTSGGTQGGLLKPSTTLQDGGNINKPGANAGKSAFKKKEPGHGAESKGKSETADNKQSTLRSLKK
jgi:hypothetical protein